MRDLLLRVGALVLSVGLVVGALVWRADRDGGDGGTGERTTAPEELALSCSRGLPDVCRLLRSALPELTLRTAAVTDQLDELGVPALVPSSWADVEDDRRARAGEDPLVRSDVLASTPVLLVAFDDRAQVLARRCGVEVDGLTWDCVGQQAGLPWGDIGGSVQWGSVSLGHGAPDTATGLLATAAVVASRTGVPFALNDLQDFEVTGWWQTLERAVADHTPANGTHLTGMVVRGPSVANVATATEAEAAGLSLGTPFGDIVVVAAEPVFWHDLVVVGEDEDAVEAVAALLASGPGGEALADAGWRTGQAAPSGSPLSATPPRAETPNGGVLTAVGTQFERVAG